MTEKPMERFNRLLKAMVQGEPPKRPERSAVAEGEEKGNDPRNPQDIDR